MKSFLNWSGGKDSAWCLYKAREEDVAPAALVTSVNGEQGRVSMHGVRRELLERQAEAVGLPLYTVELPEEPSMDDYEQEISRSNQSLKQHGFTHALSGDLFLQDLKEYRQRLYAKDGIGCVFPLWKTDTRELLHQFIASGFKAIIVCVNPALLDPGFCGRLLDHQFLQDLPSSVDPCGENGEYHSFVFDGPLFRFPVPFQKGETVTRPYMGSEFHFCELL
jgi:uncharacterized protein (TIGR00290 family)